jgi:TonB-dependent receptor
MEFEQTDVDLTYDLSDPFLPAIEAVNDTLEDPSKFQFDELSDILWKQIQTDLISTANFNYDFNLGENKAYLKTGIKYRSRERDQTNEAKIYTNFEGDLNLEEVAGTKKTDPILKNSYNLAPAPDPKKAREFFISNQEQFALDERRTREQSDPGSYEVQEDISAAYVMLNMERGRLRRIVGTRFEKTALDFAANEVIIDNEGNYQETLARTGSSSYQNYFPSAHFRYFLGDKTTLIASWTGTIQRPFYSILVPYRNIDYEDERISEGNPQLKPTLYNNLDLSIDYKLSENSTLSLELFQKQIKDIVFWEETDITDGEFAGFDLGTYNNGPSADRQGVKLIWDQKLGEWSPLLDGFSFNFNITLLDSETEYPNRPDVILPITGDHRQKHQLSLSYDKGKTYFQVLWRRDSDTLQSVDNNPWRDRYSVARATINLSASYKLSDSNRLFLDVDNLLSEPYQSYRGNLTRSSSFSLNEQRISFGLRMKL